MFWNLKKALPADVFFCHIERSERLQLRNDFCTVQFWVFKKQSQTLTMSNDKIEEVSKVSLQIRFISSVHGLEDLPGWYKVS